MTDPSDTFSTLFDFSHALDLNIPSHSRHSSSSSNNAVPSAYPSRPSTSGQIYPRLDAPALDALDFPSLYMDSEAHVELPYDPPYPQSSLLHDNAMTSSMPLTLLAPIPRPATGTPCPDYSHSVQYPVDLSEPVSGYPMGPYPDKSEYGTSVDSFQTFPRFPSHHDYMHAPSLPTPSSHSQTRVISPPPPSAQSTASNPRARTMQACEKCRVRKAKCSGDHPVCQRCSLRGLVCEYAPERKMRGPNKPKPKPPSLSMSDDSPSSPSTSSTTSSIGPVRSRRGSLFTPPSSASSSRRSGPMNGSSKATPNTTFHALVSPPLIACDSYTSRKRAITMPSQTRGPPYNPNVRHALGEAYFQSASHANSPLRTSFAPESRNSVASESGACDVPMLYSPSPFYGSSEAYPLPSLSSSSEESEMTHSNMVNDNTPGISTSGYSSSSTTTAENSAAKRVRVRPPRLDFSNLNARSDVFNPAAAMSLGLDVGAYYRAVEAELQGREQSSSTSSSSGEWPLPSASSFSSAGAHGFGTTTATVTDTRPIFASPTASSVDAIEGHRFLGMYSPQNARPRSVSDAPFPASVSMPWMVTGRKGQTKSPSEGYGVKQGGERDMVVYANGNGAERGVSGYVEGGGYGNGDAMDVDGVDFAPQVAEVCH